MDTGIIVFLILFVLVFVVIGYVIYTVYFKNKPTSPTPNPSPTNTTTKCGKNNCKQYERCIYQPKVGQVCSNLLLPDETCNNNSNCISNICNQDKVCEPIPKNSIDCQNGIVILKYPDYKVLNPNVNWTFQYFHDVYGFLVNDNYDNPDAEDINGNKYVISRAVCDNDNGCKMGADTSKCTYKTTSHPDIKQKLGQYCLVDNNCDTNLVCKNNKCQQ